MVDGAGMLSVLAPEAIFVPAEVFFVFKPLKRDKKVNGISQMGQSSKLD